MYGFSIFNKNGREVLDSFPAMYIQQSGITTSFASLYDFSSESGPSYSYELEIPSVIATTTYPINEGDVPYGSDSRYKIPAPLWPQTAMAFYRPGRGLKSAVECHVGPTYSLNTTGLQQGLFFASGFYAGDQAEYIIVDTEPGTVSGAYGMQVRDHAGAVTFDSRADLFSIAEIIDVPESVVQDILLNDIIHDVTLSQPLPGCYVSCPYLAAFVVQLRPGAEKYDEAIEHRVRIRQIASDTIRFYRHSLNVFLEERPSYWHDIFLFIARDPYA